MKGKATHWRVLQFSPAIYAKHKVLYVHIDTRCEHLHFINRHTRAAPGRVMMRAASAARGGLFAPKLLIENTIFFFFFYFLLLKRKILKIMFHFTKNNNNFIKLNSCHKLICHAYFSNQQMSI